jgi:hypothetical protein
MSESEFVTAVNEGTGLVSAIPRHYLDTHPQYKELSEAQLVELRRDAEKEMFGEAITPSPRSKAGRAALAVQVAEVEQPAEASAIAESPSKEGAK